MIFADAAADAAVADVLQAIEHVWPLRRWADVTVLVGVSGGMDSVCLLRALHHLRPLDAPGRLVVVHFDHGLRAGTAPHAGSAGDAAFVSELAGQLGLEVATGRAERPPAADEHSLRSARYDFFGQAAAQYGARYLALGHTADDQAETVLQRILRGTGLRGLGGIKPFRSLTPACLISRPLLTVRRQQIRQMVDRWGQAYRTDETNVDTRYTRNWIRHVALPTLRQRFSAADASLVQLAEQARSAREIATCWANRLADDSVQRQPGRAVVQRKPLRGIPEPVVFELFAALWTAMEWRQGEMTAVHWNRLYQATQSESSAVFCLPGDLRVEAAGAALVVERLVRRRGDRECVEIDRTAD